MAKVVLDSLYKGFLCGKNRVLAAIDGLDLTVNERELLVVLGPSGCGKSTLLKLIAGLETVTRGNIYIDNQRINALKPKLRDIAIATPTPVFRRHLSICDNIIFGFKNFNRTKKEFLRNVVSVAQTLGIEPFLKLKPSQLSTGQVQQVSLAYAILRNPKVFLFDNLLANLDAQLRLTLRTEIIRLHARLPASMIYVTHDPAEAMALGDRIAVMNQGKIVQIDKPSVLYHHPKNMFVADFIGRLPMNFIHGILRARGRCLEFIEKNDTGQGLRILLNDNLARQGLPFKDREVVLGIRPEHIFDVLALPNPNPDHMAKVRIQFTEPFGAEIHLHLDTGAHTLIALMLTCLNYQAHQNIEIYFQIDRARLFDPQTGQVITSNNARDEQTADVAFAVPALA